MYKGSKISDLTEDSWEWHMNGLKSRLTALACYVILAAVAAVAVYLATQSFPSAAVRPDAATPIPGIDPKLLGPPLREAIRQEAARGHANPPGTIDPL
jgi:hypothetical protein